MPVVLHFLAAAAPKTILDVGVGMGAYGFLARQYLDVGAERIEKDTWQTRIDGIEVYPRYRNPVWDYAYDSIAVQDVRDGIESMSRYDVIICTDVMEHFPIHEARTLMNAFLNNSGVLIVTTPVGNYPQGAWGGNEAERHHCTLARRDFPGLVAVVQTGETACYVCTSDPAYRQLMKQASMSCPSFKAGRWRQLWLRLKRKLGGHVS
jgi:2-polyprenyl-3-methyl-5-hydroxy-6-metoxy-1,4-benzoquinol methylase